MVPGLRQLDRFRASRLSLQKSVVVSYHEYAQRLMCSRGEEIPANLVQIY